MSGPGGAADRTSPTSEPATVLVVDDDPAVRRTFVAALRHGGYATLEAADGDEALDLLGSRTADLALFDVDMPGRSGLELADVVRRDTRHHAMGILFISGAGDLDSKLAGLGAGANDYLVKPVSLRELLARVGAQLRDRSRLIDRLDQQLAARSRLARRVVELDRSLPLSVLERELLDILTSELDLGGLAIRPPSEDGPQPAQFSVVAIGDEARVRVPLRLNGRLLAYVDVGVEEESAQQVVSTLGDLAPQLAAVVADSMSRRESAQQARRWIDDLLASDGLVAVYQPVIALDDGGIVGYEGLSRFSDGTRPDIAFARANHAGVGTDLETAAIERHLGACRSLVPGAWLSLNVSAATLLAGAAEEHLRASERSIVLELTENEHVDDYAAVLDRLERLPNVTLAVDDAGAGYASLRHIFELRPHLVKLDRGWIARIDEDPVRQALVHGLIGFSTAFEAQIVAEGVERREEADTLRRLGVPLAQGFLFGRPETAP